MSKIQIWKQFTTRSASVRTAAALFLICQRYKFESNSQPKACDHAVTVRCFWYVKDTNLKAIHNHRLSMMPSGRVVSDMSKIQIWKQFTTGGAWECGRAGLFLICQRYKFESNSQLVTSNRNEAVCCFWYVKDTNLKAIHNYYYDYGLLKSVVSDMSKIQIWKQFTTDKYWG